jgi:ABC-type branched-subunit amino acid transport system substrate-binding protein
VEIGLPHVVNEAALQAALGGATGASGAAPPSDKQIAAMYQAMVDYVNNHGGLLGKKIDPVYYNLNPMTAAASGADQAMCTSFTQDHHVFAVMDLANASPTLISCLQKAGVIAFDPVSSVAMDDTAFDQNALYGTAGSLSLTRVASVEVNGLFKEGYFGSNAKIGLVGYNSPAFTRAINGVLAPALAAHGLKVADQQLVAPITGLADVASVQQQLASAVLRFKGEGIDHVIFFDTLGGTVNPWTMAATAQNYFPRLGLTTNEYPAQQSFLGNSRNPKQVQEFSTALGVGWSPVTDEGGAPADATGTLCSTIMEADGVTAAQAQGFWGTCDQLLDFAAAVNAGGSLTAADALAGLAKATSLPSAELVSPPHYDAGRRDGAAAVRNLSFVAKCQCFQYSSGVISVSSLLSNG